MEKIDDLLGGYLPAIISDPSSQHALLAYLPFL